MAEGGPVIYVAGPYQHPYPPYNVRAAIAWADEVLLWGAVPMLPHLSMLWDLVSPKPYAEWLAIDLALMLRCDAVLRTPGESSGADAEVLVAEERGIPVYDVQDFATYPGVVMRLRQWIDQWTT